MPTPEYPMHEKLQKVAALSQACGEFLEWLQSEKRLHTFACWDGDVLRPIYVDKTKLLAEYFDIDLDELEREKQHMLEMQRELNASQR